jgi:hypothetical protein
MRSDREIMGDYRGVMRKSWSNHEARIGICELVFGDLLYRSYGVRAAGMMWLFTSLFIYGLLYKSYERSYGGCSLHFLSLICSIKVM